MTLTITFEDVMNCHYFTFPMFKRAVIVYAHFVMMFFDLYYVTFEWNTMLVHKKAKYLFLSMTVVVQKAIYGIKIVVTISFNTAFYNVELFK